MPIKTVTQVLAGIWPLAILAFVVALVLTPVARWLAYRFKIVDRPDDLLKPHGRPIAYLGGCAVCIGFLVALIAAATYEPHLWDKVVPISTAVVIITLTGLLDDIVKLKPAQKVLGQAVAAGVLYVGLIQAGVHLSAGRMFFTDLRLGLPPDWLAVTISAGMTLAVVVAACNATNLLDGLDGLCGGVTGIIALGFVALTVYLACYERYADQGIDRLRVVFCLCMAGAVLGFLPYNIHPASIFLGDAGSMLLGFLVATMMMLFGREGTSRWFLAACVIFALPIVDTGLAVVRRLLSGQNIFAGDRSHLYDQLIDRGHGLMRVVGLFYLLACLAAAFGVFQAIYLRGRYALPLDAALVIVIAVILAAKGMLRPPQRKP